MLTVPRWCQPTTFRCSLEQSWIPPLTRTIFMRLQRPSYALICPAEQEQSREQECSAGHLRIPWVKVLSWLLGKGKLLKQGTLSVGVTALALMDKNGIQHSILPVSEFYLKPNASDTWWYWATCAETQYMPLGGCGELPCPQMAVSHGNHSRQSSSCWWLWLKRNQLLYRPECCLLRNGNASAVKMLRCLSS